MAAARRILPCLLVGLAILVPAHAGLGGVFGDEARPVLHQLEHGPLFRVENLKPGSRVVRTAHIRNTGRGTAALAFSASVRGNRALARALAMNVRDGAGRLLYRGPLAGLEAAVGTIPAGTTRAFRIVARLPNRPRLAGAHARATFTWTATA